MDRIPVEKTYKLFIKNEFVRTESGRSLAVPNETTGGVTNVSRASRKDAREAVLAAKAGWHSWSGKTAYLRGQILYRLAEVMEGRRAELAETRTAAGASTEQAREEVDLAIDRVVHYAGWTDKISILLSSTNPVAGPHFNTSQPEPTGVVAVVPPDGGATLLTLVSTVIPVIAGGNGVIVIAPERDARTTIVFCECIATSDMPAGVINVLTGLRRELVPQVAKHMDIHALDLWRSSTVDEALAKQAAVDASDNVKRVKVRDSAAYDWASDESQGLSFIEPWLETKTIWHPVGL
jgi:acyl-CoA reductase-like NAD-dependent aldehyde dehydrogenase